MVGQLCVEPVTAETLSPGAFRGRLMEVRVIQQGGKQSGIGVGAGGTVTIAVEGLLAVLLDPAVHQHVARAGIKAAGELRVVQQGHIGHAADIHHCRPLSGASEQLPVKRGYQRCALASQRHVFVAKIADHGNACVYRQGVRAAQLNAKAGCLRAVANGLAVAANGANLLRGDAGLREQGLAGVGVMSGQLQIGVAGPIDFVTARLAQGENVVAKRCRNWLAQGAEQGEMVVANAGEDGLNDRHPGAGP